MTKNITDDRVQKLEAQVHMLQEWILLTIVHNRVITSDDVPENLRYRARICEGMRLILTIMRANVGLGSTINDVTKQVLTDLGVGSTERW